MSDFFKKLILEMRKSPDTFVSSAANYEVWSRGTTAQIMNKLKEEYENLEEAWQNKRSNVMFLAAETIFGIQIGIPITEREMKSVLPILSSTFVPISATSTLSPRHLDYLVPISSSPPRTISPLLFSSPLNSDKENDDETDDGEDDDIELVPETPPKHELEMPDEDEASQPQMDFGSDEDDIPWRNGQVHPDDNVSDGEEEHAYQPPLHFSSDEDEENKDEGYSSIGTSPIHINDLTYEDSDTSETDDEREASPDQNQTQYSQPWGVSSSSSSSPSSSSSSSRFPLPPRNLLGFNDDDEDMEISDLIRKRVKIDVNDSRPEKIQSPTVISLQEVDGSDDEHRIQTQAFHDNGSSTDESEQEEYEEQAQPHDYDDDDDYPHWQPQYDEEDDFTPNTNRHYV